MQTVFYSWQSDLSNATNRSFIQSCLEKAIKELRAEGAIHIDPSPDRDTQGVPGSPDIAETIFEKIDSSAAFVGDVSFINGCHPTPPKVDCDCTRPTPNPNVLCEWGRATKSIGFERVLVVFNEATGRIEDLPFDMRKRRVIPYSLKEGDDKSAAQKALVGKLKGALQSVLDLPMTALTLEFADRTEERALGEEMTIKGIFYEPLPMEQIPEYGKDNPLGEFAWATVSIASFRTNADYLKEKAEYLTASRLTQTTAILVKNTGDCLLRNVRLTATCPRQDGDGLVFLQSNEMPRLPQRGWRFSDSLVGVDHSMRFPNLQLTGSVSIKRFSDRIKLEVAFGDVQPKATSISDIFYVGSVLTCQIEINGLLYADELRSPEEKSLTVAFQTERRKMTMSDLRNDLPEEAKNG